MNKSRQNSIVVAIGALFFAFAAIVFFHRSARVGLPAMPTPVDCARSPSHATPVDKNLATLNAPLQMNGYVIFRKPNLPGKDMSIFDYDRNLHQLDKIWPYPHEQIEALEHGAKSSITLAVVDSMTNLVANAEVAIMPTLHDCPIDEETILSDENGIVIIESSKASGYVFNIRKEGYYTTHTSLSLHVRGFDCVRDGRWLPWNPRLAMTLKEIRNPGKLVHKTVKTEIPVGEECFFDLDCGAFLPPVGAGSSSNISFQVTGYRKRVGGLPQWKSPWKVQMELRFSFPADGCGMIRKLKDIWSDYRYVYEAPEQGYAHEIVEAYESDGETQTTKDTGLTSGEYYVFRFADKPEDFERGFRYGMFVHPIHARISETSNVARISFDYYISETVNDRNLETAKWIR